MTEFATYADIFEQALKIIPEDTISDYRPAHFEDNGLYFRIYNAVRIWLKNGDQIIYISRT